jgi:uncharacterized C2H2 Zn-finger protein
VPNRCWISTDVYGGYQFRCPLCGEQFKAGAAGRHLVPAAHCFVFDFGGTQKEQYVLAEWPSSAEEDFSCKISEYVTEEEDRQLTEEQLSMKLGELLVLPSRPWMREPVAS